MPDTPDTPPGAGRHRNPEPAEIVATCAVCGHTITAAPNRVTLNVPDGTYQVTCSGWDGEDAPHVSTRRAPLPVVTLLHEGRVPYVPQGDEHAMWATVMASVVWPGEAAPQWPAATL